MALTKVEAEQLQPAQTSITSVGTLTGLTSSGTLSVTNQVAIRETAPGIQSGHSSAHSLQVGRWDGSNNRWMIVPEPEGSPLYSRELAYNFDTDTWTVEGSFAALLSTAAQPNITSVGTLTSLDVSGALTGTSAVFTTNDNEAQLVLKSTDADANIGPRLDLTRDSASPANGDVCGQIRFMADNDAGEETGIGFIRAIAEDVSDGSEDGTIEIQTRINGISRSRMKILSTQTVFNEASRDLDFRVESNGDANMLFVDAGNDRIGIGTDSPTQKLDLRGAIRFGSTIADVADGGRPLIYASDGSGVHTGHALVIQARDGAGSEIDFVTGTTPTTRMHIGSSGNVGIGTDGPNNKLHVYKGNSGHTWNFDTGDGFILEHNSSFSINIATPSGNSGNILFSDNNARGQGRIIYNHPDDSMGFYTSGISNERMRIDSSGRVRKPLQPSFQVRYPGTTALNAGGSGIILVYNSAFHNVGNHYNTSNGRFTAPVDGIYIFHAQIRVDGFGGNYSYLSLEHFSSTGVQQSNKGRDLQDGNNSSYLNHLISQNVYLLANEYVQIRYQNNGDSSVNIDSDSYFSGYLLG